MENSFKLFNLICFKFTFLNLKPKPRASYAGLDDPIIGLGADDGDLLASAGYSIEDKKNVINFHKSGSKTPKQYELESLQRQYKA